MKISHLICVLTGLITLVLITAITPFSAGQHAEKNNRQFPPGPWPDRIMQNLTENPAGSLAFAWRSTQNRETAYVEIAPFRSGPDFSELVERFNAEHHQVYFHGLTDHYFKATVGELTPDTRYLVRVGSDCCRSEWFEARTAPEAFEPFSFIYVGDTQNDILSYAPRVYRNIATHFPDARFVMHAGDLVLSSGDDDTWGEFYEAGSWLFRQIPQFPAPGNSDHNRWTLEPVDTRKLYPQWHATFNLPGNGPEGLEGVTYYVDYPGMRLISLYSNFESMADDRHIYIREDLRVTHELVASQTEWLENVLASNEQPWTAVVFHHPVYTARNDRENEWLRNEWKDLFDWYGVDLVLQGHDHLYSRGHGPDSLETGSVPVYAISLAGPKMRPADKNHTWFDVVHEGIQMYQAIHVSEKELRYEAFGQKRELLDAFVIARDSNGTKHFTDLWNN
ncbi:MAG: metallophosphoesterase family protein [Balneolaceae bacterium]|nr:MAG: metallophosphoesterase family protein [Balneolaceae bacterium]